MTRFGKAATIAGLLLGLAAAGVALVLRDAPQEERPAANTTAAPEPPPAGAIQTRDREAEEGELTIIDRFREPSPGLTFPPAFRGNWAPSLAECGLGGGWVSIEPGGYRAPDSIAVLLEPARIVQHTTPDRETAATISPRIEQMSEGDMARGRVRMSRVGEHLYMSNPAVVGEAEHWQYRNLRCPEPVRAAN
jgi:hypothetical protein